MSEHMNQAMASLDKAIKETAKQVEAANCLVRLAKALNQAYPTSPLPANDQMILKRFVTKD